MAWAKVLVLYCDAMRCTEEVRLEDGQATKEAAMTLARANGWRLVGDLAFCPRVSPRWPSGCVNPCAITVIADSTTKP